MACFLVPTTEAIVVTVAAQIIRHNEKKALKISSKPVSTAVDTVVKAVEETKISLSRKLMWLAHLLWGGAVLLAYEHLWHGEVVPWFPFLTAASDPTDTAAMLHEMSTVGVTMAALVTAVWIGIVLVTNAMEKKAAKDKTVTTAV